MNEGRLYLRQRGLVKKIRAWLHGLINEQQLKRTLIKDSLYLWMMNNIKALGSGNRNWGKCLEIVGNKM